MANGKTIWQTAQAVYKVTFVMSRPNGAHTTSTWYWQASATLTETETIAWVQALLTAWSNHILPLCQISLTLLHADWMLMTTQDSGSGTVTPDAGTTVVGGDSRAFPPPNVSWLVVKNAGAVSRRARNGRSYIWGPAESAIDNNGVIVELDRVALETAVDAFYESTKSMSAGPATMKMSQPHWFSTNKPDIETGGIWPATSVSEVTGLAVDTVVATQRRRLR